MENLFEDLLEIMDEECKDCKQWKKNKPIIIKIYIGDEK